MERHQAVIFIAYGTRGDVQPIACLARHAHHTLPCVYVNLVTHAVHKGWLASDFQGIQVHGVDTLPARSWVCKSSTGHAQQVEDEQFAAGNQHLATWLAVQHILNADIVADAASQCSYSQASQATKSQSSLQERRYSRPLAANPGYACNCKLLVFNLFAMEGYSIAEALGVRCIAAAPYLIPYRCPSGFEAAFRREYPELYAVLHAEQDQTEGNGTMTWNEVQHWMWPLFTDKWQALRQHLKLASCPLHHSITHQLIRPLPPPPPLLYGFSPLLVPRPSYWPLSVTICGFWMPSACCTDKEVQLPEQLKALLSIIRNAETAGVEPDIAISDIAASGNEGGHEYSNMTTGCVDLASMGLMGLIPDPDHAVHVIACTLKQLNRSAVLLTGGWQPLQHAYAQLVAAYPAMGSVLYPYHSSVPHQVLLPHLSFILHPGGSGTTAAALLAGIPQLMVPCHFDQFFHAERVAYLGLAPQPLSAALILGQANQSSLTSVHTNESQDVSRTDNTVPAGPPFKKHKSEHAMKQQQLELTINTRPTSDSSIEETISEAGTSSENTRKPVRPYFSKAVAALVQALEEATSSVLRAACKSFQQELATENGLDKGIEVLKTML